MLILKMIHEIFAHNRSPSQFSAVVFRDHEIIAKVNSGSAQMEKNSDTDSPKPWII